VPSLNELMRELWLDIVNEHADEFYPKHRDNNRSEFLRDQALLFAHFRPAVLELISVQLIGVDVKETDVNDTSWYENRMRRRQRLRLK
jgi:hypothetical protein